jgi:SAM-dependent methyltransferase
MTVTENFTAHPAPDATRQYVPTFVDKWDELIHWSRRTEGEHGFFSDTLAEAGVRTVLDAAAGTGYHSVMLAKAGFEVTTADVSAPMLRRAEQNGLAHGHALRTVQADWRELDRQIEERFDAIVCLGSSFPHLFTEADRLAALCQFHARLNPGGLLIIDHRNFDAIRAHRYVSSGRYYYCGTDVRVSVTHVDDDLCRFRYDFPDETHYLEVYPVLTEELGSLLERTGFDRTATLGDFVDRPEPGTSDFIIHVSTKRGGDDAHDRK